MYEKLGWEVLDNHPSNKGEVPIMWHPMEGDLCSSRVEEVTIQVVDDSPFRFVQPCVANRNTEQDAAVESQR